MKTIEEAAKEFSSKTYLTCNEIDLNHDLDVFKAGVEFAQRWIPIEEELPPYTTTNKHNAVNVKFKTIHNDERECTATFEAVSQHCFKNSPYHNRWFAYPSGGHELRNVTHWRPI